MLVYIDDISVMGCSMVLISTFLNQLRTTFAVKNSDALQFFRGIHVARDQHGIYLSQQKYLHDLLLKTGLQDVGGCLMLMTTTPILACDTGPLFDKPKLYRQVIGVLQYAIFTRPDIAFSINKLCQFMHKPTDVH